MLSVRLGWVVGVGTGVWGGEVRVWVRVRARVNARTWLADTGF